MLYHKALCRRADIGKARENLPAVVDEEAQDKKPARSKERDAFCLACIYGVEANEEEAGDAGHDEHVSCPDGTSKDLARIDVGR